MSNPMKAMWDNSIHVDCECGCDVLRVTVWEDGDDFASLSMFKSGSMSFFTRLKEAWRYFRYGDFAYCDMMVNKDDANKIAKFLLSAPIKETEGTEP